jgi:NAD(P)-dependent dehydrogenase (short-subunit alcohol dehydrogenase family)
MVPLSPSSTTGRVAVVTGANKGIGFFIALQLGLSGLFSHIILGCRDPSLGSAASAEIQSRLPGSVTVKCLPLTIGDEVSHQQFCDNVQEEFGRLDCLVNNAGFAYKSSDPTPFRGQTKKTFEVNFYGTVDFTERMLPLLRRGTDPRLVNVASMSGRLGQVSPELQARFTDPHLTIDQLKRLTRQFEDDVQAGVHRQNGWSDSNYGMSKLALIAATKVWAREEGPAIAVNCCCPGYCSTDMSSHRGTRPPEEGARNAVIPATMDDPPSGEFFRDYQVGTW